MFEIKENNEYAKMVEAYVNNNAKAVDSFTGQVRGIVGPSLMKGDTIEWPSEYKVLLIPMRDGAKPAQAIIVKVTSEKGDVRYQPFYPSSLSKSIYPAEFDSNGELVKTLPPVQPSGTAADFYNSKKNLDIDAVMKELMAKGNIVVSDMKPVEVKAFRSNNRSQTYLYKFDFVA